MVIVTTNQYVIASHIHSITLDERIDILDLRSGRNNFSNIVTPRYDITILYAPEVRNSNSNHDDTRECIIRLTSKAQAYKVYKDLVHQIREQMPDQLFLNDAVNDILNQYDPDALSLEENKSLLSIKGELNDATSKEVRRVRKKKARVKEISRRIKTRNRRVK